MSIPFRGIDEISVGTGREAAGPTSDPRQSEGAARTLAESFAEQIADAEKVNAEGGEHYRALNAEPESPKGETDEQVWARLEAAGVPLDEVKTFMDSYPELTERLMRKPETAEDIERNVQIGTVAMTAVQAAEHNAEQRQAQIVDTLWKAHADNDMQAEMAALDALAHNDPERFTDTFAEYQEANPLVAQLWVGRATQQVQMAEQVREIRAAVEEENQVKEGWQRTLNEIRSAAEDFRGAAPAIGRRGDFGEKMPGFARLAPKIDSILGQLQLEPGTSGEAALRAAYALAKETSSAEASASIANAYARSDWESRGGAWSNEQPREVAPAIDPDKVLAAIPAQARDASAAILAAYKE